MKSFYSPSEIARLAGKHRLSRLPQTKSGWQKRIRREGWDARLCKVRSVRGGGREYHFSLFPAFLIDAIIADEARGCKR